MQPCQWWPRITVWQIHGASLEIVCSGALAIAAQVNNGCSQPTCCCQHPRKSMSTQWNEGSISVHPWCHSSSSSPVLWPKGLHCWQDSWGFIWFGKNLLSSKAEVIIFLFWSKLESESWAWNYWKQDYSNSLLWPISPCTFTPVRKKAAWGTTVSYKNTEPEDKKEWLNTRLNASFMLIITYRDLINYSVQGIVRGFALPFLFCTCI